jgi:hypothetical protein
MNDQNSISSDWVAAARQKMGRSIRTQHSPSTCFAPQASRSCRVQPLVLRYVRISYATSTAELLEACRRIAKLRTSFLYLPERGLTNFSLKGIFDATFVDL